jgi:thioredoxin-like negative regulator of GroEL
MDSLLAQLARKERHRLSVATVDVEERPEIAEQFQVEQVPTLVFVRGNQTVGRIEGRANAAEIEEFVESALDDSRSDERTDA